MKRLHVHVGVSDLDRSIGFYSTLFAARPTIVKDDYAKWMLDDPRVNFAISSGNHARKGIEHLGIQVENADELSEVYGRLKVADRPVLDEGATTCCSMATAPRSRRWRPRPRRSSVALRRVSLEQTAQRSRPLHRQLGAQHSGGGVVQ